MSLRAANNKRTLCEVLREINDKLQGTELHTEILPKLREAEDMGKRMARKLSSYNKEYDKSWWKENPDYEKNLKRRLSKTYIT